MKKISKHPVGESLIFYSKYFNEAAELWDSNAWKEAAILEFVKKHELDEATARKLLSQFEHTQKSIDEDMSEISDEFKKLIDAGGTWSKCISPTKSPLRDAKEWRSKYQFHRDAPKGDPVQFGQGYHFDDEFRVVSWIWADKHSATETLALLEKNGAKVRQLKIKGWTEKDGLLLSSISFAGNKDKIVHAVEDAAETLVAPFRQIPAKAWKALLMKTGVIVE